MAGQRKHRAEQEVTALRVVRHDQTAGRADRRDPLIGSGNPGQRVGHPLPAVKAGSDAALRQSQDVPDAAAGEIPAERESGGIVVERHVKAVHRLTFRRIVVDVDSDHRAVGERAQLLVVDVGDRDRDDAGHIP